MICKELGWTTLQQFSDLVSRIPVDSFLAAQHIWLNLFC